MTEIEKHPTYDNIIRTTVDSIYEGDLLPPSAVYIIAYMGKILYVGKTENCVSTRLIKHMRIDRSRIGCWLSAMESDWCNVRLDILEPPHPDDHQWLSKIEEACIKKFNPLFNDQLMPENKQIHVSDKNTYRKHSQFPPPYPT